MPRATDPQVVQTSAGVTRHSVFRSGMSGRQVEGDISLIQRSVRNWVSFSDGFKFLICFNSKVNRDE